MKKKNVKDVWLNTANSFGITKNKNKKTNHKATERIINGGSKCHVKKRSQHSVETKYKDWNYNTKFVRVKKERSSVAEVSTQPSCTLRVQNIREMKQMLTDFQFRSKAKVGRRWRHITRSSFISVSSAIAPQFLEKVNKTVGNQVLLKFCLNFVKN